MEHGASRRTSSSRYSACSRANAPPVKKACSVCAASWITRSPSIRPGQPRSSSLSFGLNMQGCTAEDRRPPTPAVPRAPTARPFAGAARMRAVAGSPRRQRRRARKGFESSDPESAPAGRTGLLARPCRRRLRARRARRLRRPGRDARRGLQGHAARRLRPGHEARDHDSLRERVAAGKRRRGHIRLAGEGLQGRHQGTRCALVQSANDRTLLLIRRRGARWQTIRLANVSDRFALGWPGLVLSGGLPIVAHTRIDIPSLNTQLLLLRIDARGRVRTTRITSGGFPAEPCATAGRARGRGQARPRRRVLRVPGRARDDRVVSRPDTRGRGSASTRRYGEFPIGPVLARSRTGTLYAAWTQSMLGFGAVPVTLAGAPPRSGGGLRPRPGIHDRARATGVRPRGGRERVGVGHRARPRGHRGHRSGRADLGRDRRFQAQTRCRWTGGSPDTPRRRAVPATCCLHDPGASSGSVAAGAVRAREHASATPG